MVRRARENGKEFEMIILMILMKYFKKEVIMMT